MMIYACILPHDRLDMQAQRNLRRAARHGDQDERGEDSSEVSDQPKKRPASRGRGRGRNSGTNRGRGRGKSVAMLPATRARAKTKRHDAEDANEDEAEECAEGDEQMESDNDPPVPVHKKPSMKSAAKKAKVQPKNSQD